MSSASDFTLWHGCVLLGTIQESYVDENTWYGVFRQVDTTTDDECLRRIVEFIQFCRRWNERQEASNEHGLPPPDAAEFHEYQDLIESHLWTVRAATGQERRLAGAPVFIEGGEVSWFLESSGDAVLDQRILTTEEVEERIPHSEGF